MSSRAVETRNLQRVRLSFHSSLLFDERPCHCEEFPVFQRAPKFEEYVEGTLLILRAAVSLRDSDIDSSDD